MVNVNLDRIIYQVNGKMAELEKARSNEILQNLVDKGMVIMPPEFFKNELKIPEKELGNFIYFCAEEAVFLKMLEEENYLKLIEYFWEKAPLFHERGNHTLRE